MDELFEIYFEDLREQTQKALLKKVGVEKPEEMNWNVFPLFTFSLETLWDEAFYQKNMTNIKAKLDSVVEQLGIERAKDMLKDLRYLIEEDA